MKKGHKLFINVEVHILIEKDILEPHLTLMNEFIFAEHFFE